MESVRVARLESSKSAKRRLTSKVCTIGSTRRYSPLSSRMWVVAGHCSASCTLGLRSCGSSLQPTIGHESSGGPLIVSSRNPRGRSRSAASRSIQVKDDPPWDQLNGQTRYWCSTPRALGLAADRLPANTDSSSAGEANQRQGRSLLHETGVRHGWDPHSLPRVRTCPDTTNYREGTVGTPSVHAPWHVRSFPSFREDLRHTDRQCSDSFERRRADMPMSGPDQGADLGGLAFREPSSFEVKVYHKGASGTFHRGRLELALSHAMQADYRHICGLGHQ